MAQSETRIFCTVEGKFSFKWLCLEISLNIYSKDRAGFFSYTQYASLQGDACSSDLAHLHLPKGRPPLQTAVTARLAQCFRNAYVTRTWLKSVSWYGYVNGFISDIVITRCGNIIPKEDKTKDFKS